MSATTPFWQRWPLILATGLIFSLPAHAADAQSARDGLAQAFEQAWRRHPLAAATEARAAEALAGRDLAAGLTPEPGSLSIGSRGDRFNRNLGSQEYEVELAAPLWLPGQKAAREAEADSRIEEASARRDALRLELAGELRDAWWALAAARNAAALAGRRLDTARALEADVRRLYEAGELSLIDANLARNEVHAAGSEQIETTAALRQAQQALHNLTGTAVSGELGEEHPPSQQVQDASLARPEAHPMLAAAAAAARSARAKVTLADESRRAAPELALRMVRERGDFADPYANTIGIRLKIPFSSGAQVRREVSAAEAEARQAETEMMRTQTRVQLEAERARGSLELAAQQLVLAQERVTLATDNLGLSEKAFALGETDLATLLRIRAAAFDAEALLGRQRVARAAAISRLNQALGVLP